jgi:hypothetical protein
MYTGPQNKWGFQGGNPHRNVIRDKRHGLVGVNNASREEIAAAIAQGRAGAEAGRRGAEAGRRGANRGTLAVQEVNESLRNAFGPLAFPDKRANPHFGERQIMDNSDNPFYHGWQKGWQDNRQGLEDWKNGHESNHMIPLAANDFIDTTPSSGSSYWGDDYYFPTDYIYKDTSDMYKDNPMRDDYYVQDPFSDIWGGQGGPLQFG